MGPDHGGVEWDRIIVEGGFITMIWPTDRIIVGSGWLKACWLAASLLAGWKPAGWPRPVGPDRRKELGAEVQNFTGSL